MNWQEVSGGWALVPPHPVGIVHFLGGAFVATAPNVTYRWLLESLGASGYVIIATPFVNTLDHHAIARSVLNQFEVILSRLQARNSQLTSYLPIYGLGHSMGCKLHLLIGSIFGVERSGNILISFNNYPVKRAIPFMESLKIDTTFNLEFSPSPQETQEIIAASYDIRRNLLIRFRDDELDQTITLNPLLKSRFADMVAAITLPGNHLTPLGQEITWPTSEVFTPFDAFGQWMKQEFSRDARSLLAEILLWLNPVARASASRL
jgi:hypothetical protein